MLVLTVHMLLAIILNTSAYKTAHIYRKDGHVVETWSFDSHRQARATDDSARRVIRRSSGGKPRVAFKSVWNSTAEKCEERLSSLKGSKDSYTQIAKAITAGDTAHLACHYCGDPASEAHAKGAHNWFKLERFEADAEEDNPVGFDKKEVQLDMHDNALLNRVYTTPEHTLVIKNIQFGDEGSYFCDSYGGGSGNDLSYERAFKDGEFKFFYHIDVVSATPPNVSLVSADGIRYPRAREAQVHRKYNANVFTAWGSWGQCNDCGRVGEKKRTGRCMVKIADKSESPRVQFFDRVLRMYKSGTPCHSSLFKTYPRDLDFPTEVEVAPCNVTCPPGGNYYYQKKPGLGNLHIDVGKEATTQIPAPVRKINEKTNRHIVMYCPESKINSDVVWSKDDEHLHMEMLEKYKGRVDVDAMNILHITKAEAVDAGKYSCRFGGRERAVFLLVIEHLPDPMQDMTMHITIMATGFLVYFLIFVFVSVVRHRHRQVQTVVRKTTRD